MRILLYLLISAVFLGAQTPPGGADAYSVAYVDVVPASREVAVAALRQYREESRKDEGFVRIEFFEQIDRPGHFSIVEAWSSAKALEVHAASEDTKLMRRNLDTVRTSDFDQRPYKPLAMGKMDRALTAAANDRAIHVVTHVDIGAEGADASGLLRQLAEESRRDQGNLRFDVLQHATHANHYTVIEAWQSQKALDAHAAALHTKDYREKLSPISGSPIEERLYEIVE